MAKEFNNNNPITYLRINKDGLLYAKSKEPKEGYDEVKLKNGNSTFHKTFSSTEDGHLSFIGIKEVEFDGKKIKLLEITIQGEESTDKLTFNMFKPNGGLDDYVKNIATLLPNLDFSERINIVPSRKKNERGYAMRNVFINYPDKEGDDNFVKFAHTYGDEGDIPAAVPTEKVDGSVSYDFTKQDTYLYKILEAEITRFKEYKKNNSTPSDDQGVDENINEAQTPDIEAGEDDDLPF